VLTRPVVRGAVAGAAGTTALNAVTYADMAVRGRPASDLPEQAVEKISEMTGHPLPEDDKKENRLGGLGPLGGIATGVGIGVAAGVLRPLLSRMPAVLGMALVGGAAMAATDTSLARLRLTNPAQWSTADWLSDAVPHLAYGVVTYLVADRR
jgi:hypothetical protein